MKENEMRRMTTVRAAAISAAAALAVGGAAAQDSALPAFPDAPDPLAWSDVGLSAADLIGGTAVDRTDDPLGEVHDLLMDDAGLVVGVVLEVGGVLGLAEKLVAFRAEDVDIDRSGRVEINVTPRELEKRVAFDYDDVERNQFKRPGFGGEVTDD